jgi:hypothetical protein
MTVNADNQTIAGAHVHGKSSLQGSCETKYGALGSEGAHRSGCSQAIQAPSFRTSQDLWFHSFLGIECLRLFGWIDLLKMIGLLVALFDVTKLWGNTRLGRRQGART